VCVPRKGSTWIGTIPACCGACGSTGGPPPDGYAFPRGIQPRSAVSSTVGDFSFVLAALNETDAGFPQCCWAYYVLSPRRSSAMGTAVFIGLGLQGAWLRPACPVTFKRRQETQRLVAINAARTSDSRHVFGSHWATTRE
jgi:hypothetical protein